jgi:uncharacterized spore protein YtfJ
MTKRADPGALRLVGLRGVIARLGGARLCFGEPIRVGERVVIPVARVKAAGGGGFGSGGETSTDSGGGGGGLIDAMPMGYIDAGPEGARFESIPDPDQSVRALKGAATAAATLITTVAGLRAMRRRKLLGR